MLRKKITNVQSGETKYLGLTMPEWFLSLVFLFPLLMITIDRSKLLMGLGLFAYFGAIVLYANIISSFEEDAVKLLFANYKIPNCIRGYFGSHVPILRLKKGAEIAFTETSPSSDN